MSQQVNKHSMAHISKPKSPQAGGHSREWLLAAEKRGPKNDPSTVRSLSPNVNECSPYTRRQREHVSVKEALGLYSATSPLLAEFR